MKPWTVIARAQTPDGTALSLVHHVAEYLILAGRDVLMSSRGHGSEDALATLGCRHIGASDHEPHVLIGGLGMGFTLRAALDLLPPSARVVVAELVPAVVEWNRGPLADLAGRPLDDPRVHIEVADVGATLSAGRSRFDAVLLDVDNGPDALTTSGNAALYGPAGVARALAALRPGGTLALWSPGDDRGFERRLQRASAGVVERAHVRGRSNHRGARHTILIVRDSGGPAARVDRPPARRGAGRQR